MKAEPCNKCVYLNVYGLTTNYDKIEQMITNKKPWIVLMSETHLTSGIENSEVNIKGYTLIRCDSHSIKTGGVAMYIKSGIKYSIVKSEIYRKNVWSMIINVKCKVINGDFAIMYHSPCTKEVKYDEFVDYFERWCDTSIKHNNNNLICGDFNIDLLKSTSHSERVKKVIQNMGMKQMVTNPTRVTSRSRTLIDYVISNMSNLNVKVLLDDKVSDHSTITFEVKNEVMNKEKRVTKLCGYTKERFIAKLTEVEWSKSIGMNVEEKANFLTDNLKSCLSDFVKIVTINKNDKVWFTPQLHSQRKAIGEMYRKAYYTDDATDWADYNRVSKQYTFDIKKAKNDYYHNLLFEAGNDQRKVWKILKTIINGVEGTSDFIEFNGEMKRNELEIAESFNEYFINSIRDINNSIPIESDECKILTEIKMNCKFDIVNIDKIECFLKNIKSKGDPEFLSKRVLLDALPVVGGLFADVINSSIEFAICPPKWKKSMVSPFPKIPGTVKCEEFRPVNTLPSYEKILEDSVKEPLENHVETNGIIIEEQSGFRRNHSCESALNIVLMNWKVEIGKGKIIVAVFLDLKRAFETIDRNRLICKLEQLGIIGRELDWIKSYLSQRTQATKYGGATSSESAVEIGLPQGSKLAALLFLLYINDIKSCLWHLMIMLFADDTLLYYSGDNIKDIEIKVNEDLQRINKWLNANKLKLNLEKTKFMVLTKNDISDSDIEVKINNESIGRVYTMKYLGMMINSNLKMSDHHDYMCKKIAKKIGFFARISNKLSTETRIKVYQAIIAPHFEYCSSILSSFNVGEFDQLQKLQNRGMRIILRCKRDTSVNLMLETLKWMNIKQRIMFRTMIVVFQIKNRMLPNYLTSTINYVGDANPYNLRNANDFKLKNDARKTIFYDGLKMFNELPREIKMENDFKVFKRLLCEFMKCKFVIT